MTADESRKVCKIAPVNVALGGARTASEIIYRPKATHQHAESHGIKRNEASLATL